MIALSESQGTIMKIRIFPSKAALAEEAAEQAAAALRQTISNRGSARIIAATGAAQFEFLESLTKLPGINWKQVEMFHLDEYVGLSDQHPASFCRFLRERLIDKVGMGTYHLMNGMQDPAAVIDQVSAEISKARIDVAFVGVGENGHLAFNDPPADFDTEEPYIIVDLDEACRRQQVSEAWFADLTEVPKRAISMSVRQILKANQIIAVVPDARKAQAVRSCFEGEVSPMAPASILRTHANTTVFLDPHSAALLSPEKRQAFA